MLNRQAQRLQLKKECVEKISLRVGRQITPTEGSEVLSRVREYMRELRNEDPDRWNAMTHHDRVSAAADVYVAFRQREAQQKKRRAYLQVQAQASVERSFQLQIQRGYHGFSAGERVLEEVDRRVMAAQSEAASDFLQALDGVQRGVIGFMEDRDFRNAFVQEVYGLDSGNKTAKQVAQIWRTKSEAGVDRYNRAGGDMGKLAHYIPQTHDSNRMAHAVEILQGQGRLRQMGNELANIYKKVNTRDANEAAWVSYVGEMLDRTQYLDVNGNVMGDAEFYQMLRGVYQTIVANGAENFDQSTIAGRTGQARMSELMKQHHSGGGSGRANRGELHRALIFKDWESQALYQDTFGHGTVFTNCLGSLQRTAKDAAMMEALGPNPNNMIRGLKQMCSAEASTFQAKNQGRPQVLKTFQLGISEHYFDAAWSTLNGDASACRPERQWLADLFGGARNLEVVGKLQSTLLSSISDIPSYFLSAFLNKVPAMQATQNLLHAWGPESKDLAVRGALMADALASNLVRFGANNVGDGWTGWLANKTMKWSLLDAFTNGVRQASMINLMGTMADVVRQTPYRRLQGFQRRSLDRIGVTERDWEIWRRAGYYERDGARFLTVTEIREVPIDQPVVDGELRLMPQNPITQRDIDHAATSYMAFIRDESGIASLAPDLGTRALGTVMGPRGTMLGEIWRSFLLFKSFPIGFMRRHLERMSDLAQTGEGQAARAQYVALLVVASTLAGAISVELKALAAGRDVQDPTSKDFWLQALSTGGGMGFLSDVIVAGMDGENAYGSPNFLRFMGPVTGTVLDTFDVAKTYYNEWNDDTTGGLYNRGSKANAKALRLIRGHAPFVNLWYLKGAFDRAIYNDLMEAASPGYISRVQSWGMKNTGQEYWWQLQDIFPSRLPRVADAPERP